MIIIIVINSTPTKHKIFPSPFSSRVVFQKTNTILKTSKQKVAILQWAKHAVLHFSKFLIFLFSAGLKVLMRIARWDGWSSLQALTRRRRGSKVISELFSFVRSATDLLRSLQFQELFWWGGTCGLSEISKSCDIPKSSRFIATLIFTAPTNFPRLTSGLKAWMKKP